MIPLAKPGGRPRSLEMRQVVNAILYVVVGGIQWRMLPKEYPAWQSVYGYFRAWRNDHTWQRIHDTLRAEVRRRAGRHKQPTAGCLDSQSVKTTASKHNPKDQGHSLLRRLCTLGDSLLHTGSAEFLFNAMRAAI